MKLSIKQSIYRAIAENKWLSVNYLNKDNVSTNYYLGIKDVIIENGKLTCDLFNRQKYIKECAPILTDATVYVDQIKKAVVLEQSHFISNPDLLKKLSNDDKRLLEYLEVDGLDNDILAYLSDCFKMDNDPYLKESVMLGGVDLKTLKEKRTIKLNSDDFKTLIEKLFKKDEIEAERKYRFADFAINDFSIDYKDKQYVVSYYKLGLNFADKSLSIIDKAIINRSFLIDDKKFSLSSYLDMDPTVFCEEYEGRKEEFRHYIEENYRHGEITNTRPTLFLIERNLSCNVEETFEAISEMEKAGELTQPLKAFFGRSRSGTGTKKNQTIVAFDKSKVNIDQMRVVYNSMVNHITYVQGPPGTGKTETLFNVLISAYTNDKTVLVCSNNNQPIDDICKRLDNSFFRTTSNKTSEIRLPYIRLGNRDSINASIITIIKDLNFAHKCEKKNSNLSRTNESKDQATSFFNEFRDLLSRFEERLEIGERIKKLETIKEIANNKNVIREVEKQLEKLREKLSSIAYVSNADVAKYVTSACQDSSFQNFIYYSGMIHFKKLLSDTNAELREILEIQDEEDRTNRFVKYLKDDKNFKRFQDIYPIICCTNQSCDKFGSVKQHFDLCVMDEAGQCNIATSLIPITRSRDLVLVGDVNQLQPVTVIEPDLHEKIKNKYGVSEDYNYMKNSILSTMQRKDRNSKSIMLCYHYRCGKKIAGFSNQRFYKNALKLERNFEGELVYSNVKNVSFTTDRNSYVEEATAIANLIEKNHYKDIGIITPFVSQASLIRTKLREKGINDVSVGTIHSFQGSEKSTIIFSAALSTRTGKRTMEWVKNNHELINVAVTRAKDRFVFVGDKEAINKLSQGDSTNDINSLSEYVYSNGTKEIVQIPDRVFYDYSNDSKNERAFFETVEPYFKKKARIRVERNVPLIKAIQNVTFEDRRSFGKKEFDFIVQIANDYYKRRYKTVVAFEIDGGEHVGSKRTAALDRQKEEICRKYGIKMIRISNSQVKDYELIIASFECIARGMPDLEEALVQGSLFGEEDQ